MGLPKRTKSPGRVDGGIRLCILLPSLCVCWVVMAGVQGQPGPVNIARGLSESSYTMSSNYRPNRSASEGANGDTDGEYNDDNCIFTAGHYYDDQGREYEDRHPWWQVDLGLNHTVFHFKIWGAYGVLEHLYPSTITVDDEHCVTIPQSPERRDVTVNCTKPLHGRVVRLISNANDDLNILIVCEFNILVCNPGYYGMDCDLPCSNDCSSEGCYINDGQCIIPPSTPLPSSTPETTMSVSPALGRSEVTTRGPQPSGNTPQKTSSAAPFSASLEFPLLFDVNDEVKDDTWVKYLQSQMSKNDMQMTIMKEKLKESKQRQRIFDLRQRKMQLKIAALEERASEGEE